jgi:hypothetical protein
MNNTDISLIKNMTTRRQALRSIGLGALSLAGLQTLAQAQIAVNGSETTTPFPSVSLSKADLDVIDFALNLEYLEANFYSYATTGAGIQDQGVEITGRGAQGTVTVPGSPQVTFNNPDVQQYAEEITQDEIAHVKFLRGLTLASGKEPVAQPAIDLVGSFAAIGALGGFNSSFSPFTTSSGDLNFLLGAYVFEDVGVTAYHGALTSLSGGRTRSYAAGIMGTEAYHASLIRTNIYELGTTAQSDAQDITNVRNSVGGAGLDQGVVVSGAANIVPADANAIVFARTPTEVLNIVYLSANTTPGGFFPNGINS